MKSFAESTPELSSNEIHNCLEYLESVKPEDPELENTRLMIWCGLQKMLLAAGDRVDFNILRRNYSTINLKHRELWLKRNRAGGLNNIECEFSS